LRTAARDEVVVPDHDLLARDAAQARRLDPDALDGALELAEDDRVADDEGLVEQDRDRGEEVAEDVLRRQGDRDAATPRDASSGAIGTSFAWRHRSRTSDQRMTRPMKPRIDKPMVREGSSGGLPRTMRAIP
jgi:hypothetical protein